MVIGRVFIENMTKKSIPNECGAQKVCLLSMCAQNNT
jgi:hypothetical protein